MTLIIAVKGKDFMVLGADTTGIVFSSFTSPIRVEGVKKIRKVAKYVTILATGNWGLINSLYNGYKGGYDGVERTAEEFGGHCRDNWYRWFKKAMRKPPSVEFVVAGVDLITKRCYPRIYSLNSRHSFAPEPQWKYYCASPSVIPRYLLRKNYSKKMGDNTLSALMAYVLSETADFHVMIEPPFEIHTIDREGMREIKNIDKLIATGKKLFNPLHSKT